MRDYPEYRFRELLDSLGNNPEIAKVIQSYGFDSPSLSVIKGWRTRNSVPSKWLPILMHKAMLEGALPDASRLIKVPEPPFEAPRKALHPQVKRLLGGRHGG